MTSSPPQPSIHEYRKGLLLNYFSPNEAPNAIVVYAHGGSFLTGSPDDRLARFFSEQLPVRGSAFASISYRKGGRPKSALTPELAEAAETSAARSMEIYPEIPARLFGPLLYRAVIDFSAAVAWLRDAEQGPRLSGIPLIAMGLSAGGLAAIGYSYGLDGIDTAAMRPDLTLGAATVPPQPWRIGPDMTPARLLLSRGDKVMRREAVARAQGDLQGRDAPIEITTIPYGQHNRPVRELISGNRPDGRAWSEWFFSAIEDVVADWKYENHPDDVGRVVRKK